MTQVVDPVTPGVRIGVTATGSSRHIIDDWTKGGIRSNYSVCNILVRDITMAQDEWGLDPGELEKMAGLPWCGKCRKWVKTMRYLYSRGSASAVPDWVVSTCSTEMGFETDKLADVIYLSEWKKRRRRAV